jgi:hypothetical protein
MNIYSSVTTHHYFSPSAACRACLKPPGIGVGSMNSTDQWQKGFAGQIHRKVLINSIAQERNGREEREDQSSTWRYCTI